MRHVNVAKLSLSHLLSQLMSHIDIKQNNTNKEIMRLKNNLKSFARAIGKTIKKINKNINSKIELFNKKFNGLYADKISDSEYNSLDKDEFGFSISNKNILNVFKRDVSRIVSNIHDSINNIESMSNTSGVNDFIVIRPKNILEEEGISHNIGENDEYLRKYYDALPSDDVLLNKPKEKNDDYLMLFSNPEKLKLPFVSLEQKAVNKVYNQWIDPKTRKIVNNSSKLFIRKSQGFELIHSPGFSESNRISGNRVYLNLNKTTENINHFDNSEHEALVYVNKDWIEEKENERPSSLIKLKFDDEYLNVRIQENNEPDSYGWFIDKERESYKYCILKFSIIQESYSLSTENEYILISTEKENTTLNVIREGISISLYNQVLDGELVNSNEDECIGDDGSKFYESGEWVEEDDEDDNGQPIKVREFYKNPGYFFRSINNNNKINQSGEEIQFSLYLKYNFATELSLLDYVDISFHGIRDKDSVYIESVEKLDVSDEFVKNDNYNRVKLNIKAIIGENIKRPEISNIFVFTVKIKDPKKEEDDGIVRNIDDLIYYYPIFEVFRYKQNGFVKSTDTNPDKIYESSYEIISDQITLNGYGFSDNEYSNLLELKSFDNELILTEDNSFTSIKSKINENGVIPNNTKIKNKSISLYTTSISIALLYSSEVDIDGSYKGSDVTILPILQKSSLYPSFMEFFFSGDKKNKLYDIKINEETYSGNIYISSFNPDTYYDNTETNYNFNSKNWNILPDKNNKIKYNGETLDVWNNSSYPGIFNPYLYSTDGINCSFDYEIIPPKSNLYISEDNDSLFKFYITLNSNDSENNIFKVVREEVFKQICTTNVVDGKPVTTCKMYHDYWAYRNIYEVKNVSWTYDQDTKLYSSTLNVNIDKDKFDKNKTNYLILKKFNYKMLPKNITGDADGYVIDNNGVPFSINTIRDRSKFLHKSELYEIVIGSESNVFYNNETYGPYYIGNILDKYNYQLTTSCLLNAFSMSAGMQSKALGAQEIDVTGLLTTVIISIYIGYPDGENVYLGNMNLKIDFKRETPKPFNKIKTRRRSSSSSIGRKKVYYTTSWDEINYYWSIYEGKRFIDFDNIFIDIDKDIINKYKYYNDNKKYSIPIFFRIEKQGYPYTISELTLKLYEKHN